MFQRLLCLTIAAAATLTAMPRPDDEHREHGKGHDKEKHEWKREEQEDRHYWKEHDKREEQYWKEREKESHVHRQHRYYEDERGHEAGRRPVAPPWMNGYWHSGESRRYVALVPGDPSRMYVFLDGRWVLRQVRDPRARVDLEGAFRLPMAPPPIAPPRIGVDLHVVLFN